MQELQIFNYNNNQIRTEMIDSEPWFCAKDVCDVLELNNISEATRGLREKDLTSVVLNSGGQNREMLFVSESGLYQLIFRSRKPEAEQFRYWIADEVLPAIRKTGGYSLVPKTLAEALRFAADQAEQIEQQQKLLLEQQPKAEFYDAVAGSKDAIAIGEAAKVLNAGIGQNNLFKFLRDQGVLMNNNLPYQEYCDRGYFRVVEQKYTKPNGDVCVSFKTLVYQRGLEFIRKLLAKKNAA